MENSVFWDSYCFFLCSPLLHYHYVSTSLTMQIPTETLSQSHRLCFIGKERDSETGFSYFGARYYDSDLMTAWLSVDPMADKYPSLSPYAYCAWNPIRLVDSNGMEYGGWDNFRRCVGGGLNILGGAVTVAGGIAIGAGGTVFGVGGFAVPAGAFVVTTGAYEVTQGIHKVMNVVTGTPESQDPQYTTPIGEMMDSKTADLVTSVVVGFGPSVVNKASKAVKTIKKTKKEIITNRIENTVTTADIIFSSYSSSQSSSNEKEQNTSENKSNSQNNTSNNQANYISLPIPFL